MKCSCTKPGRCPVHKCEMNAVMHEACRQSDGVWRAMQLSLKRKKPKGMGDILALGLSYIGIKKRKCGGCTKRQKWLNKKLPFDETT